MNLSLIELDEGKYTIDNLMEDDERVGYEVTFGLGMRTIVPHE